MSSKTINASFSTIGEIAVSFYSPTDFSDMSVALDQTDAPEPVIFKIVFDNITETYSNLNGNIAISNPDLIMDPMSDDNHQRHGCLYPDDSFMVCKKDFKPTLALCSQQALPNREQRRLSNKLDTLVLQGEESIISLIDRVKKVEKDKSGKPVTGKPDTLLTPKDESAPDCLPLFINFTPDLPSKFSDNNYILFEYTIDYIDNTLELLNKNNIQYSIHTDELDLQYIII